MGAGNAVAAGMQLTHFTAQGTPLGFFCQIAHRVPGIRTTPPRTRFLAGVRHKSTYTIPPTLYGLASRGTGSASRPMRRAGYRSPERKRLQWKGW